MPSFSYNQNIPDAPNNPSQDQPLMKQNTNSISNIIGVDHFSFQSATNQDGYHQQSTYPRQSGIPSTAAADLGIVYTQEGPLTPDETQLFYSPDASGDQYQLTRTNSGNYGTFATLDERGAGNISDKAGWTFLPGGTNTGALLFFYGSYQATSGVIPNTAPVDFPFSFENAVFAVNITPGIIGAVPANLITVAATSLSGFVYAVNNNTNKGFFWTAIGF